MPNEKPKENKEPRPRGQVNFNSFLLMVITIIVTLGVGKADSALTELVKLRVEHNELERRVGNVESVLGIFTPPAKKP